MGLISISSWIISFFCVSGVLFWLLVIVGLIFACFSEKKNQKTIEDRVEKLEGDYEELCKRTQEHQYILDYVVSPGESEWREKRSE